MLHISSLTRYVTMLGLLSLAGAAQAQIFTPTVLYSSGKNSHPYQVKIADVNADGKPDLLTANNGTGTVGVLLGTGTGTFPTVVTYNAGPSPTSIAVADVNGDSKLDLLTAATAGAGVLLGNGDGTFKSLTTYATSTGSSPTSVVVADVNGDGKLDLLAANFGDSTAGVLLGNGNGTFQTAVTYSIGGGNHPLAIAVADVNGDSKLDLLTASSGISVGMIGVLLGKGNGTFENVANYSLGKVGHGTTLTGLAVADVNGDGKPDVLASNSEDSMVGVLLGNGNGLFSYGSPFLFATGLYPSAVVMADVNGDGKLDAITADNAGSSASVLLSNGNGTFQPPIVYPSSYQLLGLAVGDVNGDNKLDIITVNWGTSSVGVLLNTAVLATRALVPGASACLYPNPARSSSTLTATGLPAGTRSVETTLYNSLGQVVRHREVATAIGVVQAELPTVGLPIGAYLLRLNVLDAQGTSLGTLPTQRLSLE
jgi:uncharacterized protein (DUF2141 family)